MKIGLISDIHANYPALQAILADMSPVNEIVCAGDVIGYNPMSRACVDQVQEVASITVQGNHDRVVENPDRYRGNEMAFAGLKHARNELSDTQRKWLQDLPQTATFGDGKYLLVHSHPATRDKYVYPENYEHLREYLDDFDGLVLGHTHIQHKTYVDDRIIINPGSVGQPRDGNPHAAYAILDTETNGVELHRTKYDIDHIYDEIIAEGLPSKTAERLLNGE